MSFACFSLPCTLISVHVNHDFRHAEWFKLLSFCPTLIYYKSKSVVNFEMNNI